MGRWLLISLSIHAIILALSLGGTGEGKQEKAIPRPEGTRLQVSLSPQSDRPLQEGQVRGFPQNGEAPSDTYVPDGTCAWSIDIQKQLQENPDWYYEQD